ncbi:transposase [Mesorhizobium yinganensis]|uniref:transposase n=1 Tax=Mesorhizobium yinganensis TaxID=3157707 RepID=UPI0032B7AA8D
MGSPGSPRAGLPASGEDARQAVAPSLPDPSGPAARRRPAPFFRPITHLTDGRAFRTLPVSREEQALVVYVKAPFAGLEAVLTYLARYTHQAAISNHRLIAFEEAGVTFRYKDYRRSLPPCKSPSRAAVAHADNLDDFSLSTQIFSLDWAVLASGCS